MIGNQLLKFRKEVLHETQKVFAERLGIRQNQLSMLETGVHAVSHEQIKLLRDSLGLSIEWLYTGEGSPFMSGRGESIIKQDNLILLPVKAVAGIIGVGIPAQEFEGDRLFLPNLPLSSSPFLGVEVQGSSMSPTLINGDVVIMEPQPTMLLEIDRVYVVSTSNGVIIKRFHQKSTSGLEFRSDNPKYPSVFLTEDDSSRAHRVIYRMGQGEL
jgi:transcriptional regulator with XRE-family HTH domain